MKHLDIKRALAEHGITLVKLGEKLNVFSQSLTSVIKGNPTVKKLEEVATAIGCDITDLFYSSEDSSTTSDSSSQDNNYLPTVKQPDVNSVIETTTFCPHCGKKVRLWCCYCPNK